MDTILRNMWAVPRSAIFWTRLMLMLPGIWSMNLSSPFFTSPRAPMTTGIVSVFIPHILLILISRSLYLDSFSVTFTEVFRSEGIDTSMSIHLWSFLSLMMMSDRLWRHLSLIASGFWGVDIHYSFNGTKTDITYIRTAHHGPGPRRIRPSFFKYQTNFQTITVF